MTLLQLGFFLNVSVAGNARVLVGRIISVLEMGDVRKHKTLHTQVLGDELHVAALDVLTRV